MILAGVCLYRDSNGLKLAFAFRGREKVILLRRREIAFAKAPEMAFPSMLTEKPDVHGLEPEDMDKEPEKVKLIEPEDM